MTAAITPHTCKPWCTCPIHGTPLTYSAAEHDHACQDVDCEYVHGGCEPLSVKAGQQRYLARLKRAAEAEPLTWQEAAGPVVLRTSAAHGIPQFLDVVTPPSSAAHCGWQFLSSTWGAYGSSA